MPLLALLERLIVEDLARAVDNRTTFAADLFDQMREATFDGVGITRASYGEGEQKAHDIMAEAARSLGLGVAQDPACNSYFTLAGKNRRAPSVLIGSHLDSVAQGGNFDGAAGVVSGLTALAALKDAGITPNVDVTVMGIRAEESAWFGVSYLGSRAALGLLPKGALEAKRSDNGRSLAEHLKIRFPDFKPEHILDIGCTVGHNLLPFVDGRSDPVYQFVGPFTRHGNGVYRTAAGRFLSEA